MLDIILENYTDMRMYTAELYRQKQTNKQKTLMIINEKCLNLL